MNKIKPNDKEELIILLQNGMKIKNIDVSNISDFSNLFKLVDIEDREDIEDIKYWDLKNAKTLFSMFGLTIEDMLEYAKDFKRNNKK